jgi:hypothetical protein
VEILKGIEIEIKRAKSLIGNTSVVRWKKEEEKHLRVKCGEIKRSRNGG